MILKKILILMQKMFTYNQARELITIPKSIVETGKEISEKYFDEPYLWNHNFSLQGVYKGKYYFFLWHIWQSEKNKLKMSLHFQEDENKIGLFRIDYNAGHKNPDFLTDKVPKLFHPFVGKFFHINEHHVHYHVEGYKQLAWAIPIAIDEFPQKDINLDKIWNIIISFAKTINLQTKLYLNLKFNL